MANAEIVAIGSELLLGQIVDTNSTWMAQRLTALGVNLFYKSVVGDNPERMKEVLTRALERADVVITSGGLGPTQDDLTREVVAEVTGRKLVLNPHFLEQIDRRFRSRGFIMTPNNERQAYMPEGAIPVDNPNGTAPSFIVEDPRSSLPTAFSIVSSSTAKTCLPINCRTSASIGAMSSNAASFEGALAATRISTWPG